MPSSRVIFPTQGSNPGLLHCRQILYCLSHQRSPRILEWAVYPFFRGSSWPRNWTGISCISGRFFSSWANREAHDSISSVQFSSVQFSHSVVSFSLQPHGLQHARFPCPSPTPGAYSNSYPSRWRCYPTISSCHLLLHLLPIPPSIKVFSNESTLCMRWPKY